MSTERHEHDPRPRRLTIHDEVDQIASQRDVEEALDALFGREWLHVAPVGGMGTEEWWVTLPSHVVEKHRDGDRFEFEVNGYVISGVVDE